MRTLILLNTASYVLMGGIALLAIGIVINAFVELI